jgi:hypothetical protein
MVEMDKKIAASQLQQDGAMTVLSATVELTDTQFKALPTTVAEIVPNSEAGKVVLFLSAVLLANVTGGAYGNITDRQFEFTWGSGNEGIAVSDRFDMGVALSGNIGTPTLSTVTPITASVQALEDVEARSIVLRVVSGAGDFTDGDSTNTVSVTVLYVILDV